MIAMAENDKKTGLCVL